MQKVLIGALAFLSLFLAVATVRVKIRERALEERLAVAERRAREKSRLDETPVPPPGPPTLARSGTAPTPSPSLPLHPPAGPKKVESSPGAPASAPARAATDPAEEYLARALQATGGSLTFTLHNNNRVTVNRIGGDDDLGLTEAQRKAIDDIRKNRDSQSKAYSEWIDRIDQQSEESIRHLLTPDQLAKYDAQHPPSADVQAAAPADDAGSSSGVKPGYLGIGGADAAGGGTQVTQVLPNTVASALGILKDDVILEVSGKPVSGLSELADLVRTTGEGSPVMLKIRRSGGEFYLSGQLGGRPK
jgi:hypothetical protein